MTFTRLLLRNLTYHWRTAVVVVLGLTVATAVVTGALVTGDSVRGSLRDVGLARLGRIDHVLVAPRYFRAALASDLLRQPEVKSAVADLAPLLMSEGAARNVDTNAVAPGVTVFGVDAAYWRLQGVTAPPDLSGRGCAVSSALATDLSLRVGDSVILTVHHRRAVASDTLFARRGRRDVAPTLRLAVRAVLPAGGVGDLRLDTASSTPRNLFISRAWLAGQLGLGERANVLVAVAAPSARPRAAEALKAGLAAACTLRDHGLSLARNPAQGYLSLTSDALVLTQAQVEAAQAAARECGATPALTSVYLAARIAGRREIAYAVIAGMEPLREFRGVGPRKTPGLRVAKGPGDGGIWLNSWAAQDLGCRPLDRLTVTYLVPARDGSYPTAQRTLTLEGLIDLTGAAADPKLVPDFEGISNARRMADWDPPFPIDLARVTPRDEAYWEQHRATPKAFVSLATARSFWQSGPSGEGADWVTSVRIGPSRGTNLTAFERKFASALLQRLTPEGSSLAFTPLRELTLSAARGTSDFRQLFLGLSLFLVLAGAGLAGMLLALSVDRRASEAGIMLACGFRESTVSRVLLADGLLLALLGALAGVPCGVLYAGGLIHALGSLWKGALGAMPSLWLHVEPGSLFIGAACGVAVGLGAAILSARRWRRRPVLELLAGWRAMSVAPERRRPRLAIITFCAAAGAAVALGVAALATDSLSPQGAFFGLGGSLLVAGLALAALALRALRTRSGASRSLVRLALRNTAAGGGRSLLTLGLLASATFLIVATATNTKDLSQADVTRRDSGAGGFALQAASSVPLPFDPATPTGRQNLGFSAGDEAALSGVTILSFLASPGEDISCLNPARPASPRLVGVAPEMIRRGGFSVTVKRANRSPWTLLDESLPDGAVPAFGDAASVQWTLHSGLGRTYEAPAGRLRFVGLLQGSLFARELLVSAANFRRLFPSVTAPSYFLIETPPGCEDAVAEVLRRNLGDLGLQVRRTGEVLNDFVRVQNTYLSVFLTLGGLGLLLGTVGLAVTLVRNAAERRRELALLTAVGFSRGSIARSLLIENGALLIGGLLWGALTALVAVLPHLVSEHFRANWLALIGVLLAVLVVGLGTCLAAVWAVLRADLIPALRQE